MGYYDIDDILADGTEVPCKFNYDIPGLGYLENNPGKPVRKNTKLQLPLWLARVLAIVGAEGSSGSGDGSGNGTVDADGDGSDAGESFVELLTPDMFSARVMNAIKADGRSLDLHALSPHFLEVALKWVALFSDHQLGETVYELILERALLVNNHASSVSLGSSELGGTQSSRQRLSESLRLLQQGSGNLGAAGALGRGAGGAGGGNSAGGMGPGGDSVRGGRPDSSAGGGTASSAISASQATNLAASSRFLLTLDESERALYKRAHDSYRDTKRWMMK